MPIKWGVIGAGGIADRRTIPEGILPAKNSRLIAVMDTDEQQCMAVAHKYGDVKAYVREQDLLTDADVDAVYIATPTWLHRDQTCLAAEAGKHVLCEKPMALTTAQCEDMIAACRLNHVKLALGFMMRFQAQHLKILEMIRIGDLGRIVFVRAQLSCWYPPIAGAWRQNPQLGGGGSLIDMGSHCIDLLEMLVGRVKRVSCVASNLVQAYKSEDSATVLLEFENGTQGVVDSFFSIPDISSKNRLEIYGTRGSILAEGTIGQASAGDACAYLEHQSGSYAAQQDRELKSREIRIEAAPVNIYQAEIEHFAQCIEKDTLPINSGEAGLRNLIIINACYEAARIGRVLEIPA